jgi:hypothetical protein
MLIHNTDKKIYVRNGNIPWVVQEARGEGEFLHEKYTYSKE